MENLEQVGGDRRRLARVKALLWSGKVDAALKEFDDWEHPLVDNFRAYVTKHRHRIVNYGDREERYLLPGKSVPADLNLES